MLWIVWVQLLPDALKEAPGRLVALTISLSIAAMIALQVFLHV